MPELTGVTLRHRDSNQAAALLDAIRLLCDTVFSQPPLRWPNDEAEHHRQSLAGLITNPTFGLVIAEAAGEVMGFAYGVTLRPDTQWWSGMAEPLPYELAATWNGRTFITVLQCVPATTSCQPVRR